MWGTAVTVSIEKLHHMNCGHCHKWWTIGDANCEVNQIWYCPWCGVGSVVKEVSEVNVSINVIEPPKEES